MLKRLVLALIGLFLLLGVGFSPDVDGSARTLDSASASSASELIDAVNSLRASHGLPPYTVNSILMGTAQGQSDYMASIGTWSHTGPGGSSVTQRILAAGYPLAGDLSLGGFRSENVIYGTGMTAAQAVSAWTGDAPHLHTMLSTDLVEIGAGATEKDGDFYYVIDCARPTSSGAPQAYTPGAEAQYNAGINDIIVPVSKSTPDENGDVIHEVQSGQSLWQIAIQYGVKIADIERLNNLGATPVIYPGDKLLIMKVGTSTPAPSATPTETQEAITSPPLSTVAVPSTTPSVTATLIPVAPVSNGVGVGGAVAAIIIVALVAAGLVAWAGRARDV